jgi:hypothetical protein
MPCCGLSDFSWGSADGFGFVRHADVVAADARETRPFVGPELAPRLARLWNVYARGSELNSISYAPVRTFASMEHLAMEHEDGPLLQ